MQESGTKLSICLVSTDAVGLSNEHGAATIKAKYSRGKYFALQIKGLFLSYDSLQERVVLAEGLPKEHLNVWQLYPNPSHTAYYLVYQPGDVTFPATIISANEKYYDVQYQNGDVEKGIHESLLIKEEGEGSDDKKFKGENVEKNLHDVPNFHVGESIEVRF